MTRRKYKPYPEYKDSGVEWLGRVPRHWENMRLRHVAPFKNSNVDKKSYDGQKVVRLCNYTDVYYNEFITNGINFMEATASDSEIERFSLRKGHVVFTKDSEDPLDIGIPALVIEDFDSVVCGYHLALISPDSLDLSRFIFRFFQSHPAKAHFFVESPGITRYGLSQDAINDLPIPVPSKEELHKIGNYIHRETSRIDRLIEKKERFIELLKEKRQALITHAVTKGLPPEAAAKAGLDLPSEASAKDGPTSSSEALAKDGPPMKDSGIEWIGEVPAHWEVKRLKHLIHRIEQGWSPQCDNAPVEPNGWGILKTGCVNGGNFNEKENKALPPDMQPKEEYEVQVGDVLMSRASGSVDLIGTVAIVEKKPYARLMLSDKTYRLIPNEVLTLPMFLVLSMGSGYFRHQIKDIVSGAEGLANNIAQKDLKELVLPSPPLREQKVIQDFLLQQIPEIARLVESTSRSISLLRERRTALITAAVTGQIDVREAVAAGTTAKASGEATA